jgi:hypothetical protein
VLRLEGIPSALTLIGPEVQLDLTAASDKAHLQIQVDENADFSGTKAVVVYDVAGTPTYLDGLGGPLVDLSTGALGLRVGAEVNVSAAAKLLSAAKVQLALVGGNGTTRSKVRSSYLGLRPGDRIPIPPTTGDLPTGGAYGSLVLDLNAISLIGTLADGAVLTGWPDDSAAGNDGVIYIAAPTFQLNGLGTGIPSVRFNGVTQGIKFPMPAVAGFTYYIVVGNMVGVGSNNACWGNACLLGNDQAGGSSTDFSATVRADGKIAYGVGESIIATTASGVTANAWSGARKDVHAFVRKPTGGEFFWYVNGTLDGNTGNSTGANLTDQPFVYLGNGQFETSNLAADYGRVTCWNAVHGATEITAIVALLRSQWGDHVDGTRGAG